MKAPIAAAGLGLAALAALPAQAQPADAISYGLNPVTNDRVYVHGYFDHLEGRLGDNPDSLRWDGQLWAGTDTDKLWIKSEGRFNDQGRGQLTDGDQEFLYDRPLTRYFDVQAGVRTDLDSGSGRTWAALGLEGLAPYDFDL